MDIIKGPGYEVGPDRVVFQNKIAVRSADNSWSYDQKTASEICNKTIDEVYADFEKRLLQKRDFRGDLSRVSIIVCSPFHAVALYVHGIITPGMFQHMEKSEPKKFQVTGDEKRRPVLTKIPLEEDCSPTVYFKKQEIIFQEEKFEVSILIDQLMDRHLHCNIPTPSY